MASATEIAARAEEDVNFFAVLVNPLRVYGNIHEEMGSFLTRPGAKLDQLVLLPRAHQKSHYIAVWCAWWITKYPDTTVLYCSATEDLAIAQLSAIKNIMTSDVYRRYWPTMVHADDAKRDKWAMMDINVDHPKRKESGVRDFTVSARSVGGNTTGLHCDVLILDDVVAPNNAYTEDGRRKVMASYAQFTSILNPGGFQKVVGTRYHGKDLYAMMMEMEQEIMDDDGQIIGQERTYDVLERSVEVDGQFLWPRTQQPKSKKWFGFDQKVLSKIRAKYFGSGERAQYYAQYYNNPDDPTKEIKLNEKFQYYDPKHLICDNGVWCMRGRPLSVFAAADLAYTTKDTSDYTAFAVIGVDEDGFIYILELEQFRTDQYSRYYATVDRLHRKWLFRHLRIEANTGGANLIVKYIQDMARSSGLALAVEGKPAKGEKTERTAAILEPRYEAMSIWHYKGGQITAYEEQMLMARPAHDDLRDAVAAAVEISKPAHKRHRDAARSSTVTFHPRFGGRIR